MRGHSCTDIRVASRTQAFLAGCVPILREAPREPITDSMSDSDVIDYERLRVLVRERVGDGKGLSPRAASLLATEKSNPDLVRNFLTGTEPLFPSVVGLCRTLKIPIASIIKGLDEVEPKQPTEWLTVLGSVRAGTWKEEFEWPPDEHYQVQVERLQEPGTQIGLVVEGQSMNKTLPQGTVLRCLDLISSGRTLQDGSYVIVERMRGELRELTCKRTAQRADGSWDLLAESWVPDFKEPIRVGRPLDPRAADFDSQLNDETRVRAVVLDAFLPLSLERRPRRSAADMTYSG